MKNKLVFVSGLILVSGFSLLLLCEILSAEEILLKNGDKITGSIIKKEKKITVIQSKSLGELNINNNDIKQILTKEELEKKAEEKKKEKKWKLQANIGGNASEGNTVKDQLNMLGILKRVWPHKEFSLQGSIFYSSADREMDEQQWDVIVRYRHDIAKTKWYYFGQIETDHDKFADVNYRILPQAGVGYKFYNQDDFKLWAEVAPGYEFTNYVGENDDDTKVIVLVSTLYVEKMIFNKIKISEQFDFYPSMGNAGEFRFTSLTALTSPITENLSLQFSVLDEFNSVPPSDTKKNDLKLILSLVVNI